MVETNDGFRIAEVDLQLRGPGEFFGTRQSGLPEFRVADLLRDAALLEEARREAQAIIAADPELRAPEHRGLRVAPCSRAGAGKLALAVGRAERRVRIIAGALKGRRLVDAARAPRRGRRRTRCGSRSWTP